MNPAPVQIDLPSRSYSVHIGSGLLARLGDLLPASLRGRTCAVVSDTNVAPLYAKPVLAALAHAGCHPVLVDVPAGEASKSLAQVGHVCDRMIGHGLDRGAFVAALGGGVVGDLAGFVAAVYFRGIPFIQIPTTIVAQVDSAVGGKTGVNAAGGKNLIGAFHQPCLVVADTSTLDSLPDREFNEGFAEVIKHAIIRDPQLFEDLGEIVPAAQRDVAFGSLADSPRPPRDRANLARIIRRNVEIKAAIVAADETESSGTRALLNFGHTIGHAIENAAGYGRLLHGEAISLGILAATSLSVRLAGMPESDAARIRERLRQFHLPDRLPGDIPTPTILAALRTDKKFAGGKIRFVLSPRIGDAFVSDQVTPDGITAAIEGLRG